MHLKTDEQLIIEYRAGREEALRELIERHFRSIYNFIYRFVPVAGDAEDLAQDVFFAAWKNLKKFDTDKKFTAWLFTIARNAALNWIKKKKPISFSQYARQSQNQKYVGSENANATFDETIPDPSLNPAELFEQREEAHGLTAAVRQLTPAHQHVLALRHTQDYSFQEISAKLNESIHTVKSRHRRALFALRKILSNS